MVGTAPKYTYPFIFTHIPLFSTFALSEVCLAVTGGEGNWTEGAAYLNVSTD